MDLPGGPFVACLFCWGSPAKSISEVARKIGEFCRLRGTDPSLDSLIDPVQGCANVLQWGVSRS